MCQRNESSEKIAVERYQGREISYITEKTYRLLKQIKEQFLVVPTTTRTKEQYDRIDLKAGAFPYALVCNGGVLLVKGERDEAWYRVSKELASEGMRELYKARGLLEKEALRKFEIRLIDADIGIVPAGFCKKYSPAGEPREMKGEGIFSDEMLSWIMEYGLRTNR